MNKKKGHTYLDRYGSKKKIKNFKDKVESINRDMKDARRSYVAKAKRSQKEASKVILNS